MPFHRIVGSWRNYEQEYFEKYWRRDRGHFCWHPSFDCLPAVMRAFGFFTAVGRPTGDGPFALATIYRTVYGVAAAYITARLAPNRSMMHAIVLGVPGPCREYCGCRGNVEQTARPGAQWYPLGAHRARASDRLDRGQAPPDAATGGELAADAGVRASILSFRCSLVVSAIFKIMPAT